MSTLTELWGSPKKHDKGGDSADKCGGCCHGGGKEESGEGTRRWEGRKTLQSHKYLSPPKFGLTHIAATVVEEMEDRVYGDWGGGCSHAGDGNLRLKYSISVRGRIHGGTLSGHAD